MKRAKKENNAGPSRDCTTYVASYHNARFCAHLIPGTAEPVPEVRDCAAGPHALLLRAGGAAEPRPHGTGLPARGEDAPQQAQAGNQVQAEEGEERALREGGGGSIGGIFWRRDAT